MRYGICFVSTASDDITLEEIKDLLNFTAKYNNEHDIRGIMLYGEGNFFQIFEGEKNLVEDIFLKIKEDSIQKDIIQVVGKNMKQGAFDGFKAAMVNESNKCDYDLVKEYMVQVEGLDKQTQKVVKHMMEVFIDTN